MNETDEFFQCRQAAYALKGLLEKFGAYDVSIVADFLERQRRAAVEEQAAARLPTYSNVAVNQLLAQLQNRKQDAETTALVAALRASYQIR